MINLPKLFRAALFAPVLLTLSCQEQDNTCGPVPFTSVDFSAYSSVTVENNLVEDKFMVINSEEEFNEHLTIVLASTGTESPALANIDFSKNTLLIGKKALLLYRVSSSGRVLKRNVDRTTTYIK